LKQNQSNHPLNSREYKIMLVPREFKNIEKGIERILDIVHLQLDSYAQLMKDTQERERKRTWFVDTADFDLFKNHKFIVRMRQGLGTGEIETTLKCRHPDRYISASQDLGSKKNMQVKFEEDISVPFRSQFSQSATFKNKIVPDLDKFRKLRHFFPKIKLTDIDDNASLKKVNNFEPTEASYKIGSIKFTEKNSIELYLNLWYLGLAKKSTSPLIVELTFNCQAKKLPGINKNRLEEFSIPLLKETNNFYLLLQENEMADRTTTKTKTEFAYTYKAD